MSESAEFEPGMVGQLFIEGNSVVVGVSNGLAPLGLIDDIKTKAFTAIAWDETIIVPATGVLSNGQLVTPVDIKTELANPNVLASSFISIPVPVSLIARNGVIIFPAGTPLNFDLVGSGTPNAIKTNVRYSYQIPNIIGDSSVEGSRRCTIWFSRMIFETDKFSTSDTYPVNANLFVNEFGFFCTTQPSPNSPAVAIVLFPPSAISGLGTLCAMWL